jgi:small-conductance mechanosensitive channel
VPSPLSSSTPIPTHDFHRSEARISHLTLALGIATGLPVAILYSWRWGLGILVGAVLAWLNFRWLRQGLDALTNAATAQANHEKVHVPFSAYVKAAFRYGLIALIVYVIFKYLNVPVLSMVLGLCALGAATMIISVHSIFRPSE